MSERKIYILHYWLKNTEGEVVDTSQGGEPMTFVDDSKKVIPGLLAAVQGRNAGDRLDVTVPPEMAYGAHDPALVNVVPRHVFDGVAEVKPGMKFQTNTGDTAQIVKVVEVKADDVLVDANHPLAGLTLYFELDLIEVRAATEEELKLY